MTVREIAEQAKVAEWKIYYIAHQLGRLPTVDEVVNYKKRRGRPPKYENNYELLVDKNQDVGIQYNLKDYIKLKDNDNAE
jgi:hypothetical protein